jgi:plasmid stability protein
MPRSAVHREALRNFHVPLPDDLYEELKTEAAAGGRSASSLAREAIAHWLALHKQARVHREVLEYATAMAGTAHDLDIIVEAASLEVIVRHS